MSLTITHTHTQDFSNKREWKEVFMSAIQFSCDVIIRVEIPIRNINVKCYNMRIKFIIDEREWGTGPRQTQKNPQRQKEHMIVNKALAISTAKE